MMEEYVLIKRVQARRVPEPCMVDCYNGRVEAQEGDYIVVDEDGKTMVMKGSRFEANYDELGESDVDACPHCGTTELLCGFGSTDGCSSQRELH